ncbi:MAG: histidine kinase [Ferruginibacter sp.]
MLDDSGFVWVGSQNGLQKFNPQTKQFQTIQFVTRQELEKNVNNQSVYNLLLDSRKKLWCNAGGNLYLINRNDLSYKKIVSRQSDQAGITSIYEDSEQQYWISYWGYGFSKFDGEHQPAPNDFIAKKSIYFRFAEWKDTHQNKWLVLTRDNGIDFYNRRTGQLMNFSHDNTKPYSFNSHDCHEVMTDKDNNVWIGATRGIELLEPSKQFFQYHWIGEKKDREDPYIKGIVMPVIKDGNNYLAGLWYGKGMIMLDSNWNETRHYKRIPENSPDAGDATVYSIYTAGAGIYWISTDEHLVRYSQKNNTYSAFQPSDITPDFFQFRTIKQFNHNNLLIRTSNNGLYLFDMVTNTFQKHIYNKTCPGFPSNTVNDFCIDEQGTLWVATKNGLCCLDTAGFLVKKVYQAGNNSLPSNECWSLGILPGNKLLIATQQGLCRMDIATGNFTSYTTANGLPSNACQKLMVDNNNNVWIKTSNGISFLKTTANSFVNFYKEDGLPQNALEGTINKDSSGMIYFGDAALVLTVNPNEVPYNDNIPPVIITDALADGTQTPILFDKNNHKYIVTQSGNSSVSIQFAVLNFTSPQYNKYYYKLDTEDKNWHESDRGIASYINLPPGSYLLRVKGSNNSGIMNEEGDFIRIEVKPLWYQTLLFKLLLGFAAGLLIVGIVKRRIQAIKKQAALKQQVTETKMQALRAQMNPHFIFNSLNSIENFIMRNEKRLASDYLNKFARLIRMILDSSRNDLVPFAKDMDALQLYIDLEQLRFNHTFSCTTDIDTSLLQGDYKVPSLLIQPYVENAIVHGLAHSEAPNLQLTIKAAFDRGYIHYSIADNGIGRLQADIYNNRNKPYHKSVGMEITAERIARFNKDKITPGPVKITDLYDASGHPAGTLVEIWIAAI